MKLIGVPLDCIFTPNRSFPRHSSRVALRKQYRLGLLRLVQYICIANICSSEARYRVGIIQWCMSGPLLSVYSGAYFSGFVHVLPPLSLFPYSSVETIEILLHLFPLLSHLSSSCSFSRKCFAIAQWRMLELFLFSLLFSRLLLSSCEMIHEGEHASFPLARFLCTWWFVEGTHLLYVKLSSFPDFCRSEAIEGSN